MTKRIHLTLPEWMKREMGSLDPDRVRELLTKGLMYEREQLILNLTKRKDKKAFCVTESRDFNNGLAGFPESAV